VVASEEVDDAVLNLLSDLSEMHPVAGAGRALAVNGEDGRKGARRAMEEVKEKRTAMKRTSQSRGREE
jgi:hypothetical protein